MEFLIFMTRKKQVGDQSSGNSARGNEFQMAKNEKLKKELLAVAQSVHFPFLTVTYPSQVKKLITGDIIKGITRPWPHLKEPGQTLLENSNSVYARNNMRAMYIAALCRSLKLQPKKLLAKINAYAPNAIHRGLWNLQMLKGGLECSLLRFIKPIPTLSYRYVASIVKYTEEDMLSPWQKKRRTPVYCAIATPSIIWKN